MVAPIKGLRRHYNADIVSGTKLSFPEHSASSGLCSNCIKCGICEVGKKAKIGTTIFPEPFGTTQFGAEKRLPNIYDLQIIPQLIGKEVIFEEVSTATKIGSFSSSIPVSIAAMGSTIVAHKHGADLSRGAAEAGIPTVIGENVLASYGENALKERIKAFLDSYDKKKGAIIVQANIEDRKQGVFEKAVSFGAMAIEIKLGQGAKMCLGGEITFVESELAEKYKKLGYKVIQKSPTVFQRHSSPGSISKEELKQTVLKYKSLKVPIWIKTGIGRGILQLIEWIEELNKKEKAGVTCLTIDGFGGGTGMSPWLIMNETGIPSASVLQFLNKKYSFDIAIAGGYSDGTDAAKALMLGANSVSLGRAFLIAAAVGKEKGIKNYCSALKEELQMVCATQRASSVQEIIGKKQNLFALKEEAAKMFGLSCEPKDVL